MTPTKYIIMSKKSDCRTSRNVHLKRFVGLSQIRLATASAKFNGSFLPFPDLAVVTMLMGD